MKIYNEIVIDMMSGAREFEDSYDYNGPTLECKGGGPSGTVVYPTGITNAIQDYLGQTGAGALDDIVDSSIVDLFNAALTTLGSDIMQDGGFDDNASWTKGSGWAVAGSKATLSGQETDVDLSRTDLSLTEGATYQVVFTTTNLILGDGTVKVRLQGGSFGTIQTVNGTFTENLIAGSGTSGEILFRGTADVGDSFDIDTVTVKLLTGSPYAGQKAFDPSTLLDAMQTRFDTFNTEVIALDEETDWESMRAAAIAKRTSIEFPDDDVDSRLVTINAAAVAASKLAAADAVEDADADLTTIIAQIDTELSPDIVTLTNAARLAAKTSAGDAVDNAKVDITAIVNQAMLELDTDTTTLVNSAVAAAKNAIDNAVVQDMIDQFELRQKSKHFRTINRFAGGMADINAVQSSAMIFGMAQLESEFNRDVADFDKEMVKLIFEKAFNDFTNIYIQTFSDYISGMVNLSTGELGASTSYPDIYKDLSSSYLDTFRQLAGRQLEANNTQARIHVDSQIRTNMQIRQIKDNFLMQSISEMSLMLGRRVDFERAAASIQADMNRMRVVALKEQTDRDIELDSLDALWDIKLYQYVGNMIGSPGGGSGFIPDLPSSGSSALGGALSGVGAGAAIGTAINPGVGTAIGAGIGALIGGIGGSIA